MQNIKEIDELIEYGIESDHVDFKTTQYSDNVNMLKDIIGIANSFSNQSKYIIFGIKVNPANIKDYIGIEETEFKDSAEYQQLVYSNIEPDLHIEYFPYYYKKKLLGILRIKDSNNKPYILKKDFHKLKQGLCYVRKGSQQKVASREDYDRFYFLKEEIGVSIKDTNLYVRGDNGLARMQILFKNYSNNPTTIIRGNLEILSPNGNVLTVHQLYGFDKVEVGADFTLELKNKTERLGEALFGFESSDCIRLDITSDGFKDNLKVKVTVWDSNGHEYSDTKEDMFIIVKGKALWKVDLKEKQKSQTV